MQNPELATGAVEMAVDELVILNEAKTPPIGIDTDGTEIGEDTRMKYRYVDLRRSRLQKNPDNRIPKWQPKTPQFAQSTRLFPFLT